MMNAVAQWKHTHIISKIDQDKRMRVSVCVEEYSQTAKIILAINCDLLPQEAQNVQVEHLTDLKTWPPDRASGFNLKSVLGELNMHSLLHRTQCHNQHLLRLCDSQLHFVATDGLSNMFYPLADNGKWHSTASYQDGDNNVQYVIYSNKSADHSGKSLIKGFSSVTSSQRLDQSFSLKKKKKGLFQLTFR